VLFSIKKVGGKSSITCNLAAICAKSGAKTLVIALDSQANSTHYLLGRDAQPEETITDYFTQTLSFNLTPKKPDEFVTATPYENFLLLLLMQNWRALSKNWNHDIKFISLEIY
jgi:chromosome partitioning protein